MNYPKEINGIHGVDFFFSGDKAAIGVAAKCLERFNIPYVNECLKFTFKFQQNHPINGEVWAVTAFWDKKQNIPFEEMVERLMLNREIGEKLAHYIEEKLPRARINYIGSEFYCFRSDNEFAQAA